VTQPPLIVNLMPHGPAYEFAPGERPDVAWARPDGAWVGFWRREWPDLLGASVLRAGAPYQWEVWQPDLRADRPYADTLDTGVVHRLFPAIERRYRRGLRRWPGLDSESVLGRLGAVRARRILLVLHGFRVPFYGTLLGRLGPERSWPVLLVGHGTCTVPSTELRGLHRPVTYLDLVLEHRRLRRELQRVDAVTAPSTHAAREIRKVYRGPIEPLTMGCDFDFWRPVPDKDLKRSLRAARGLGPSTLVLFASGNFVPLKQFDRLVEAVDRVQAGADVRLVVAGHGDARQTGALAALVGRLRHPERVVIHPYAADERLRELSWIADAYVSTSTAEGSSVAVMKAMACGLPVVTTPVGETWERMRAHGAGAVIPVRDYAQWTRTFEEILAGALPPALDPAVARAAYDWSHVATRFVRLVDRLLGGGRNGG
jgi:glycosyltransferase involved in cell wall biosynthesis